MDEDEKKAKRIMDAVDRLRVDRAVGEEFESSVYAAVNARLDKAVEDALAHALIRQLLERQARDFRETIAKQNEQIKNFERAHARLANETRQALRNLERHYTDLKLPPTKD